MFEYKNDRIFLLSVEEYNHYKDKIPEINCWWWLRSPGYNSIRAADVNYDGSVSSNGDRVNYDDGAVRPTLYFNSTNFDIGDRFVFLGVTWIVLDKNLAIAEMPITFSRFDKETNDYEKSEVRQYLLNWFEERKNLVNLFYREECKQK